MKTNVKKSIISAAFMLAICSVCLTAKANPVITGHTVALSDTGKMDKMSKMSKTDKMKAKKMGKMSKDKMSSGKMSKGKMSKDSSKM